MISLDLQSRIPIYEQIFNGISRLCVTGVLKADEKLPSVRSMATDLGVNPNTVQKAYQQLESAGYIYSIEGRGSFVHQVEQSDSKEYINLMEDLKSSIKAARRGGIPVSQVMYTVSDIYSQRSDNI